MIITKMIILSAGGAGGGARARRPGPAAGGAPRKPGASPGEAAFASPVLKGPGGPARPKTSCEASEAHKANESTPSRVLARREGACRLA